MGTVFIHSMKGITMRATITISVKTTRLFQLRIWLTIMLMRLAARVSGMAFELRVERVESPASPEAQP